MEPYTPITPARFERLVEEALESIPEELWELMENVAVMIEDWPSQRQMRAARIGRGHTLLGLYEGVPLTERTHNYGLVAPDKITIFRGPILRVCRRGDEDEVRDQVRRTVLHEVAHHFGIDDDRLIEIDRY